MSDSTSSVTVHADPDICAAKVKRHRRLTGIILAATAIAEIALVLVMAANFMPLQAILVTGGFLLWVPVMAIWGLFEAIFNTKWYARGDVTLLRVDDLGITVAGGHVPWARVSGVTLGYGSYVAVYTGFGEAATCVSETLETYTSAARAADGIRAACEGAARRGIRVIG